MKSQVPCRSPEILLHSIFTLATPSFAAATFVAVGKYHFDHYRVFDAGNHVHCTTAFTAKRAFNLSIRRGTPTLVRYISDA